MNLVDLQQLLCCQLRNIDASVDPALLNYLQCDRMAVYRGNVIGAQVRALESTFPVIQRILGERFFGQMLRAYVLARPYTERDLELIGEHFSDWLAQQVLQVSSLLDYAYLPELAKLEVAHQKAVYSVDPPRFPFEDFKTAAAQPEQLRFQLNRSLTILEPDYPIDHLWIAQQAPHPTDVDAETGSTGIAVYRHQQKVLHQRLDEPTLTILQEVSAGATLEKLATLADLARSSPLAGLIESGLITGFNCGARPQAQ